jgi:hypothetical protein
MSSFPKYSIEYITNLNTFTIFVLTHYVPHTANVWWPVFRIVTHSMWYNKHVAFKSHIYLAIPALSTSKQCIVQPYISKFCQWFCFD